MSNSKLYLVIGGSGFIGSHTVKELCNSGNKVRVFGRDICKFEKNIGYIENAEWYRGDLNNSSEVDCAMNGVTDIIYLASDSVPATSMTDFSFDIQSNTIPLIKFLETLKKHNEVRRFIYMSSGGTVYGSPDKFKPLTEKDPTEPISSYGLNKLMAEHYIKLFSYQMKTKFYILRPGNVYGENQDLDKNQGAVGIFLKSIYCKKPLTIYGEGIIIRDFIYVGDIVRGIIGCLNKEPCTNENVPIFNLGTCRGVSIMELVNEIESIIGNKFIINAQPNRKFDCMYNVLDISKINEILGWQPNVMLDEGIKRTWKWIIGEQK